MRALVYDGTVRLTDGMPIPKIAHDEALIAVGLAGICNTDLEIVRGYKGFRGVLGHEFVGTVIECEKRGWIGKRVVGEINVTCGVCDICLAGRRSHCRERTVLGITNRDGAFAEYLTLPLGNLHVVPDEVADDAAVFTEPLAAAFEVLEQVSVSVGDRVAVLGDGKLALLCAQVLDQTGADVTMLGKHPGKIALAQAIGIQARKNPPNQDEEFDLVVEATGSSSGFQQSLNMIRPRGTIVVKSTIADSVTVDLSRVAVDEITVIGSRCGPFGRALVALQADAVQVTQLISERFSLGEGVHALERARQPGVLKVLLEISRS